MSTAASAYSRTVTVTVPATTANLGPGFDCLGLALELRNAVTATVAGPLTTTPGRMTVALAVEGVDAHKVPADATNLFVEAAEVLFERAGRRPAALAVRMVNRIPVGSGLGSSSSAIVAGLLAANALVDGGLAERDLLALAVEMEGHPDNVAPALLGGLVLGVLPHAELGPEELILRRLEPPALEAVVVLPDFALLTADARAVLPPAVPRADAIFNTSRLGLLLHALATGDLDCLRVAMQDRLHQPYRLSLIPGAEAALAAAYDAGAAGVALSGAGPSLIAFTRGDGQAIAAAMAGAFAAAGLNSRQWLLSPAAEGARCTVAGGRPS